MKQILRKGLTVIALLGVALPVLAAQWKLKDTRPYGTGGYWENGQKVRIDCSYKAGVFQYERKVTVGSGMNVYNARAEFALPKASYDSGEDISVLVDFSDSGVKGDYSPYARVTLLPIDPQWPKAKGASNQIEPSVELEGQAVDAVGRNQVTPKERVTLMANAYQGTTDHDMCIVYSCNGMDVLFLYEWEGEAPAAVTTNEVVSQETTEEPAWEPTPQEEWAEETVEPEENTDEPADIYPDWDDDLEEVSSLPKLLKVGIVALALIAIILFLFRKKKPKTPAAPRQQAPSQPQQPQAPVPPVQQAGPSFCPNCGAKLLPGSRFCDSCGQKLF